jgi:hypothetical protein
MKEMAEGKSPDGMAEQIQLLNTVSAVITQHLLKNGLIREAAGKAMVRIETGIPKESV